jgi:hypothetical protein
MKLMLVKNTAHLNNLKRFCWYFVYRFSAIIAFTLAVYMIVLFTYSDATMQSVHLDGVFGWLRHNSDNQWAVIYAQQCASFAFVLQVGTSQSIHKNENVFFKILKAVLKIVSLYSPRSCCIGYVHSSNGKYMGVFTVQKLDMDYKCGVCNHTSIIIRFFDTPCWAIFFIENWMAGRTDVRIPNCCSGDPRIGEGE